MPTNERMTPALLRANVEAAGREPYFFTRESMRFFGDTMANYAVTREPVTFKTYSGETVTAWELRRKRPVKHGLRAPAYFDVETFRKVCRPDCPTNG
jgi:hypothetical protein